MAISKNGPTAITWPTAQATVAITAGSSATSEEFDIADATGEVSYAIHAALTGTPAAGDYIDIYLLGSIDGTNFATPGHPTVHLGRIDLDTEDPLDFVAEGYGGNLGKGKLFADSNAASTITLSLVKYLELQA